MEKEGMLSVLTEQNVAIFDPSSFDVKTYIDQFLKDYDLERTSFVPVGNPEWSLDFEKEYREDGSAYCTVSSVDDQGYHQLLSENEKGYMLGHINEVRTYIEQNYGDGFYNETEAKEKIEDYNDRFFEKDEAYEEHLIKLGEAFDAFYDEEPEEEIVDFEQYADENIVPEIMPEIYPEEHPRDLSQASIEEQIEALDEATEPGGRLWENLRLQEIARDTVPVESKVSYNELNLEVSEKVKEYFRPSEEKQPYFDVMERGFIPFEIREGFHDNRVNVNPDLILTKDIVDEVRQKIDPEFGMVAGIDTTSFHVRSGEGFEKNISIIPMRVDEFRPYLTGDQQFNIDDIKSVRAIKEHGDSLQIQGVDFRINNLVTFELRSTDQEVYRSSLIVDDSGRGRARLDFLSDDFQKTFRIESGSFMEGENVVTRIHFDSLDRTNLENPNHFRIFEQKGPEFRSEFLAELEDRIPAFFDMVADRLDAAFRPDDEMEMGRKDFMELNMESIKGKIEGLHYTANLTELYRENLLGKASAANQKCARLDDEMNYADMDRKELEPDSKEYAELTQKIESLKEEYGKSYHEYLEYKNEYLKIEKDADEIKEEYLGLTYKYDRIQDEYDKLMGRISANGSERDIDNSKLTPEERYSKYCDIALLRTDMLPSEISYDYEDLVWDKTDLIKDAYDTMEREVAAYNETVDHPFEKVQFMNDPEGIYTTSGYAVEAESISEKRLTGQQYEPLANREEFIDSRDRMVRKPVIDEDGKVVFGHADVYSLGKPAGLEETREEIRDKFVKNGIRCGVDSDQLTLIDHSLSGKMLDNDLYHEVDAIRMAVRDHQQEPFEGIESYRKEIDEYKESLDNETEESIQKFYEAERGPQIEQMVNENDEEKSEDVNFGKKIRAHLSGLNGGINTEKSAELSSQKIKELKEEAKIEAEHSDRTEDEIYKEKEAKVKETLEEIRGDILHYRDKMDSFSDIPTNYLRSHCGYGLARTEYNAAINQYEKAGGKVHENAFVTKGISNSELYLVKHEFYNADLSETVVLDGIYGKNSLQRIKDVTRDENGNSVSRYSGMSGKALEVLFRPLHFITWPAIKIYGLISRIIGGPADIETKEKVEMGEHLKNEVEGIRNEMDRVDPKERIEEPEEDMDAVVKESKMAESEDLSALNDTDKNEDAYDHSDVVEHKDSNAEQINETDSDKLQDKDIEEVEREEDTEERIEKISEQSEIEELKGIGQVEHTKKEPYPFENLEEFQDKKEDTVEQPDKVEKPEEETGKVENPEEKPEKIENPEEKTEKVEKPGEKTEEVEKPEDKTDKVEKPEEKTEKVEKPEEKTEKVEKPEEKADKVENPEEKPEKVDEPEEHADKLEKFEDTKDKIEQPEEKMNEIEHSESDEERLEKIEQENTKDVLVEESQKDAESKDATKDVELKDATEETKEVEKDLNREVKDDAMASDGEDLTREDSAQILSHDEEDSEEEEKHRSYSDKKEEKEDLDELLDRFSDVLDLKETFEDLCRDTLSDILKGADPSEVLDVLTDRMSEMIGPENLSTISDTIYDFMNVFGDSPIETLEHIMDRFTEHQISDEVKEDIMERIGDIYDGIEGPFEDTSMGEIGDIEFTFDGTYQSITGTEELSLGDSSTLPEMELGAEQAVELEQLNQDLEILQQANDIESGLEADGFSPDIASDVSNDMFDQMQTDFYDGQDVFDQDYMDSIEQNATDQAQEALRSQQQSSTFDANPQDIDFGTDLSSQDFSPDMDASELAGSEEAAELSEVIEEIAAALL